MAVAQKICNCKAFNNFSYQVFKSLSSKTLSRFKWLLLKNRFMTTENTNITSKSNNTKWRVSIPNDTPLNHNGRWLSSWRKRISTTSPLNDALHLQIMWLVYKLFTFFVHFFLCTSFQVVDENHCFRKSEACSHYVYAERRSNEIPLFCIRAKRKSLFTSVISSIS